MQQTICCSEIPEHMIEIQEGEIKLLLQCLGLIPSVLIAFEMPWARQFLISNDLLW